MTKAQNRLIGLFFLVFLFSFLLIAMSPSVSADPIDEPIKQGLVTEDGKIYFYNDDGTLFNEGYKVIEQNGKRTYYYFQEDGSAFTDGYLSFTVDEKTYYFFFQEDGTAFTGGYKEIMLNDELQYFYFLPNGQGFNTGYKTVMIDGKKHYFYFNSDGTAVTNELKDIPLGERMAYMLFNEDGRAYTNGYKELTKGEKTDYYYFLSNGQAFTTGYKTVKIDDITYYFYFENDGKAFTEGMKAVPFGNNSFYYFFDPNGRAKASGWETIDGKPYYFQTNGRAAQNTFINDEGKLYYFDDKLELAKDGWFCVGNGYYHADENGALATDTILEGYVLDSTGKSLTKYQILYYVNQCTNSSMTDQQKIDAIYDWILYNDMDYHNDLQHVRPDWVWKESWINDMANVLLTNLSGNCFQYASFMGLMVHEATGLPVTVYHGMTPGTLSPLTPHGWLTVHQEDGRYIYDVQLDKFYAGYLFSECYKVPEAQSLIHLQGVGTTIE